MEESAHERQEKETINSRHFSFYTGSRTDKVLKDITANLLTLYVTSLMEKKEHS